MTIGAILYKPDILMNSDEYPLEDNLVALKLDALVIFLRSSYPSFLSKVLFSVLLRRYKPPRYYRKANWVEVGLNQV